MTTVLVIKNALSASARLMLIAERCGMGRVLTASSLREAQMCLKQETFDLILADTPTQETEVTLLLQTLAAGTQVVLFVSAEPEAAQANMLFVRRPVRLADLLPQIAAAFPNLKAKSKALQTAAAEAETICQAKHCLMLAQGWDEAAAHRWLEKQAMDRQLRKLELAQICIEAGGCPEIQQPHHPHSHEGQEGNQL